MRKYTLKQYIEFNKNKSIEKLSKDEALEVLKSYIEYQESCEVNKEEEYAK